MEDAGRRRGQVGTEDAVNILQDVNAGCWWAGVVSSYLVGKGSRVGRGPAQGSHSNFWLKPTAGVGLGEAFGLPLARRGLAVR